MVGRAEQPALFAGPRQPEGFLYRQDFLTAQEEGELAAWLAALPFRAFEFRGYQGRRRVVSFGWRYDFNGGGLQPAADMPPQLLGVRARAAELAGLVAGELPHALLTEYAPGAPIGWHRDRSVFGEVVGISLLSACTLRFRRRRAAGWERWSTRLQPRSAYLLAGAARREWEHSIPPVEALRYSITFRRLQEGSL